MFNYSDPYRRNENLAAIRQAVETVDATRNKINAIIAAYPDIARSAQISDQVRGTFAAIDIARNGKTFNQISELARIPSSGITAIQSSLDASPSVKTAFLQVQLLGASLREASDKLGALSGATGRVGAELQKHQVLLNGFLPNYRKFMIAQRLFEMQALIEDITSSQQVRAKALLKSLHPLTTSFSSLSCHATVARQECLTKRSTSKNRSERLEEASLVQTHEAARNVVQLIAAKVETEVEIDPLMISNADERCTLMTRLEALGLEYVEAWTGAKIAILDKRPDYIRHASVSVRELLDSLLVHLAPAKLVKKHPESAALLKNQSRKARLIYLSRELPAYAEFVAADIDCILQTFYPLNDGIHKLKHPFSDEVMETLITRIEGLLVLLLDVANL
ncbi:hypothetical protein LEP3755_65390 (plasmid) [Leptolyngbya sp. NIES-3755]|nr:hypothetical protein LEP3755_65390 [Leptolyngbya sp. NIES-3755]